MSIVQELVALPNISSNNSLALQRQLDGAVISLRSDVALSNGSFYFVNNIQSFSSSAVATLGTITGTGFLCSTLAPDSNGQFSEAAVNGANVAQFLIRYNSTSAFYTGANASLQGTLFNMYYVSSSNVIDVNPVSQAVNDPVNVNGKSLQRIGANKDEASGETLFSFDLNGDTVSSLMMYSSSWEAPQYAEVGFFYNNTLFPPMVINVSSAPTTSISLIPVICTPSPYMVVYNQSLTTPSVLASCCSITNGYTATTLPCNETNTTACEIELCQDQQLSVTNSGSSSSSSSTDYSSGCVTLLTGSYCTSNPNQPICQEYTKNNNPTPTPIIPCGGPCASGQNCNSSTNQCETTNLCANVTCPSGSSCDEADGSCVPINLCANVTCASGYSCASTTGACSKNPMSTMDKIIIGVGVSLGALFLLWVIIILLRRGR